MIFMPRKKYEKNNMELQYYPEMKMKPTWLFFLT